jgi:hypothetical protein
MTDQIASFITSIVEHGIIIVAGAYALGEIIKQSLDFIPNKYIPLINGAAGIVLAVAIPNIFPGDPIAVVGVKGLIAGLAPTGIFELVKNLKQ